MTNGRPLTLNQVETRNGAYESLWVLLRRFLSANELRPPELVRLFPAKRGHSNIYERIDLSLIAPYIGQNVNTIGTLLPRCSEFCGAERSLSPIKLCPECAEKGYHSTMHEVNWLDSCPIHGRPLLENCPKCNRWLSFISSRRLGQTPRTLPCGHMWTTADIREPPELDVSEILNLKKWLDRLRARNRGERWYSVALGNQRSLKAGSQDFNELLDLFAGMANSPRAIRTSLQASQFNASSVRAWTTKGLCHDWFESTLANYRFLVEAIYQSDRCRLDLLYHMRDAIAMMSRLGRARLVAFTQKILCTNDLSTGETRQLIVTSQVTELVAAVFLAKYCRLKITHRTDLEDSRSFLSKAVSLSGQPLGILHINSEQPTLYWSMTTG